MAELLEKTNSSYFVSFKEIFRDVVAGRLDRLYYNNHGIMIQTLRALTLLHSEGPKLCTILAFLRAVG